MAAAFPPLLLPKLPKDNDPGFCTPGNPLIHQASAYRSQAASALQCWSWYARDHDQDHTPALPLGALLHQWGLPPKGKKATHSRAPAYLAVQEHNKGGGRGNIALFYPDRSVVVLRTVGPFQAEHPGDQHCHFLPLPLMLPTTITAFGSANAVKLHAGLHDGVYHLSFPRKGRPVFLTGHDPKGMDKEAMAIYAGIVHATTAWARAMDTGGTWRVNAPQGRDWGTTDNTPWMVPPYLPHRWFSTHEQERLQAHLTQALIVINHLVQADCSAFGVTIQAGQRSHAGRLVAPTITVRTISRHTGGEDPALQRRIKTMVRAALDHPACPVAHQRLNGTALYYSKSAQKPPEIQPIAVFSQAKQAEDSAHDKMAAMRTLGLDWAQKTL